MALLKMFILLCFPFCWILSPGLDDCKTVAFSIISFKYNDEC